MWNDRMPRVLLLGHLGLNISDLSSATVRGARGAGGSRLRLRRATGTAAKRGHSSHAGRTTRRTTLYSIDYSLYGKMSSE